MYRIHFDTGAGTLCGSTSVLGWTTKPPIVTCPACRARLSGAAPAERRTATAPKTAPERPDAPVTPS